MTKPVSTGSIELPAPGQEVNEPVNTAVKTRILVMDDEKCVREITGRMLKHLGYEDVEFASDGNQAIMLYKAAMEAGQSFRVVILDLMIAEGMGGETTVSKLLEINPHLKAIVCSGYADCSVIARYREHGFSGRITKPYTLEELSKALSEVTG